jgi:hypothetical protein
VENKKMENKITSIKSFDDQGKDMTVNTSSKEKKDEKIEKENEKNEKILKDYFKEIDDVNKKMDEYKIIIGKVKQLQSDLFNLVILSKKKRKLFLNIIIKN